MVGVAFRRTVGHRSTLHVFFSSLKNAPEGLEHPVHALEAIDNDTGKELRRAHIVNPLGISERIIAEAKTDNFTATACVCAG